MLSSRAECWPALHQTMRPTWSAMACLFVSTETVDIYSIQTILILCHNAVLTLDKRQKLHENKVLMTRITTANTNSNTNMIEVCVFFYMCRKFILLVQLAIWHSWHVLQGSLKPRVPADIMYTVHELPCSVTHVCKIINNIYCPVWWATQMSAKGVWLTHFIRFVVGILTASSRYCSWWLLYSCRYSSFQLSSCLWTPFNKISVYHRWFHTWRITLHSRCQFCYRFLYALVLYLTCFTDSSPSYDRRCAVVCCPSYTNSVCLSYSSVPAFSCSLNKSHTTFDLVVFCSFKILPCMKCL